MTFQAPISPTRALKYQQTQNPHQIASAKWPVVIVSSGYAEKFAEDAGSFLQAFPGVAIIFETAEAEADFEQHAHPLVAYYASFQIQRDPSHVEYSLDQADYIVCLGDFTAETIADIRKSAGPSTVIGQGEVNFAKVMEANHLKRKELYGDGRTYGSPNLV